MRTNCRRVSIFEYAISVELLNNSPRRSDSREKHGGYFRPCVKNGGKINFQEINLINRSMKKRKISDILQSDYNSKRKKKGQEDYFCTFCINLNLHYLNYFQTRNDGYIYISPVKYICEFERGWKYNSSVYRFPLRDEVILELPSLYVYIYIHRMKSIIDPLDTFRNLQENHSIPRKFSYSKGESIFRHPTPKPIRCN